MHSSLELARDDPPLHLPLSTSTAFRLPLEPQLGFNGATATIRNRASWINPPSFGCRLPLVFLKDNQEPPVLHLHAITVPLSSHSIDPSDATPELPIVVELPISEVDNIRTDYDASCDLFDDTLFMSYCENKDIVLCGVRLSPDTSNDASPVRTATIGPAPSNNIPDDDISVMVNIWRNEFYVFETMRGGTRGEVRVYYTIAP